MAANRAESKQAKKIGNIDTRAKRLRMRKVSILYN